MNTSAGLFKLEATTNVAVVIPDGGPRLTLHELSAQIVSPNGTLLAGSVTPGSFATSK